MNNRGMARLATMVVAGALGFGSLTVPALAATGTPSPAAGDKPVLTATQQAVVDAQAKAKSTGQTVVVDALTTETSKTLVNPDGTLSTTDNAAPVRTKRDGNWAELDPALHKNADGSLSPAVSTNALTVSGGGEGPLATITTPDGKSFAISAPFKLPKPTWQGSTATYASVLPDVDLQLTALPDGGWRDVIVVRTAAAAADPKLKQLRFPVKATGLSVSTDESGSIALKDSSGQTRLHAPTPLQWDSALPAPVATGSSSAGKNRSLLAAPKSAAAPAAAASAAASDADGPGAGATAAAMGITADSTALTLTPDSATFGKGTGPWYLDPTVSADSPAVQSIQVQEYHPDTKYADKVTDLGVGYCGYSDCTGQGRERAYYGIGINSAIWNQPGGAPERPTIYKATFYADVTGASSPGTSTPLGLYWAGQINGDTTWRNQPCNGGGTFGGCSKIGNSYWITGTGPINFDVTWHMQQAAANKDARWTFGIAPDDENNKYYRKHIKNNPHIVTDYDMKPSVWWPRTSPAPGFASNNSHNECQTPGGAYAWYNPGWVGANQNLTLTASSWSPTNMPLVTKFRVWDDQNTGWGLLRDSASGGGYNDAQSISVNNGELTDGHQYGWLANSTDGGLTSPDSAWCYFRVDKTAPTVSIGSTDFPPSGTPNDNPAKFSTDQGTFTVGGDDPVPAGGAASGIACIRWSTSSTPVTGWNCNTYENTNEGVTTNGSFHYTPGLWGTNILYVQSQDNAGNYSQPAPYSFYAPWKPGSMPVLGDVNGDAKPDIVLPDANGNLRLVRPTLDPSTAAPIVGPNAASPTSTWAGVQVSHRATLIGGGKAVDDLIVHATGDSNLYLYPNDGHGNFNPRSPILKVNLCQDADGATITCPAGYGGTSWANATQVVSIGGVEGENLTDPQDPTKKLAARSSLLTVIDGKLWLFPHGETAGRALSRKGGAELSTKDWSKWQLINPGPANGPTMVGGKPVYQATLWARNTDTGDVRAYAIGKKADGTEDYSSMLDPDTGYLILTGSGTNGTAYPQIGSSGDITGDGFADLWTVDTNGTIGIWKGVNHSAVAERVDGFNNPTNIGALNASVSVHSAIAGNICLDAEGGPNPGAAIAVYNCWNGINQHFQFASDGTIRAGANCVGALNNGTGRNTNLAVAPCSADQPGQKWAVNGNGRILNVASNLCVDLPGANTTTPGLRVILWDCGGLGPSNQAWTMTPNSTT
ncbi:RICIN domain-containing protein [Kitasatospora sp. MBT63]|uniref:RICIN domain-containing protein n=1 Tax=Kitasatospora sp. MBT63 TaxID=1444768 RepID=UPI0011EA6140|nr:RICIN domain-containing protein [Kitasatospora sp. MBT63]